MGASVLGCIFTVSFLRFTRCFKSAITAFSALSRIFRSLSLFAPRPDAVVVGVDAAGASSPPQRTARFGATGGVTDSNPNGNSSNVQRHDVSPHVGHESSTAAVNASLIASTSRGEIFHSSHQFFCLGVSAIIEYRSYADGLTDAEGLTDADGLFDADGETDGLDELLGLTDADGDFEADGDFDGEFDEDGLTEADGLMDDEFGFTNPPMPTSTSSPHGHR